jgi:hypothetical protein
MLNDLAKMVALAMIDSRGARNTTAAVANWTTAAGFAVGTVVTGTVVFGCLMAALWIAAEEKTGSAIAWLIVGAAVALSWSVAYIFTRKRSSAPAVAAPDGSALLAVVRDAQDLFDRNKGAVMLAALLAGLVTGGVKRPPTGKS